MKAVIPAAGYGTRFLPASKTVPKEMLPVGAKPAIQLIVEEAVDAGAEEVVVVTSRDKPSLMKHFAPDPVWRARCAKKPGIDASHCVCGYRYPGRRHDIGNPRGYFETLAAFNSQF